MTSKDRVDFFWRPGCGFCMSLERRMKNANVPFRKLNIWDDKKHASYVRSVAKGNETVPTIRVGEHALVNPSLGQVLKAIEENMPHLLPKG